MVDVSVPIELSFVLGTIGIIFAVVGVCVYLVKLKTVNKEK